MKKRSTGCLRSFGSVRNIPIPAGDYKYRRYSVSARSDASSKIGGQGSVDWGDFWDGDRTSFSGTLSLKPNYHLNIDLSYSHNRVNLPNGRFTTDLTGLRFLYAFTPRVFFNAFIQYNAARNQLSSNIRFHVIHHPLSDLYLVYNDLRDTNTGQLTERAFTVKLTNLFNFLDLNCPPSRRIPISMTRRRALST